MRRRRGECCTTALALSERTADRRWKRYRDIDGWVRVACVRWSVTSLRYSFGRKIINKTLNYASLAVCNLYPGTSRRGRRLMGFPY